MYRLLPLAPLFTIACLVLIFLVWRQTVYLEYFNAPWVLVAGLCCTGFGALIALFSGKSFQLAYDLFCLGIFCIWFVHWREVYRIDAPVFAWYPIYFVSLIVVLNRQVIHQWHRLDALQMQMVRLIQSLKLFQPWLLITGVPLSVYFSEYYIFYPIVVSLVLIRCCFGIVLRESAET
ncbi:MAG: hypothetical protein L0Y39_12115 [Methylococcaceae bacterium]|nr:hypothetical protein [Methylococcaceae bacterium]